MLDKIKVKALCLYAKAIVAKDKFKNDERGLSETVTTVLLILVAVLAVVLIWGFLDGWLQDLWNNITGHKIEGTSEGYQGGSGT